ncbi:MAG: hypothetical protein JWM17_2185, partial [Actinobacteria bacterium]|nr:hypothetical protein [Actinomycetota bacterium]
MNVTREALRRGLVAATLLIAGLSGPA